MAKQKRTAGWSFESVVNDSRKALRDVFRLSPQIEYFKSDVGRRSPQSQGSLIAGSIGVERQCELNDLLARGNVTDDVWHRLHVIWRYDAYGFYLYIERLEQLLREYPEKPRGQPRIGLITDFWAAECLMTMALSAVLGEDQAADWLGRKCLGHFLNAPWYVTPEAYSPGPVAPFLLKLYGMWCDIPVDLAARGVTLLPLYQDIFDEWDHPEHLENAVLKLCEMHVRAALNRETDEESSIVGLKAGIHRELPTEVLLIQRIRCDRGLSVPNPDHPMLRSPLAQMPYPCPKSGYDPWIAESMETVRRKNLPDLRIEWEEQFQAAGPTDPRRLPETDYIVQEF